MKKNRIRLTKSQLNRVIKESVENILREKFEDNELRAELSKHGGIDGKMFFAQPDLEHAEFLAYLPKEMLEIDCKGDIIYNFCMNF